MRSVPPDPPRARAGLQPKQVAVKHQPPGTDMLVEPAFLFGSAAARDALRVQAESHVARALAMMRRARSLVHANRVRSIGVLTASRIRLAGHLQRYQQFKHGMIFGPVIQHGTSSSQVVARSMKVDCIELGDTFAVHHMRWLHPEPVEWPSYCDAMLATTDLLCSHLEAELRAIRQLLMISDLYRS